MEMFDRCAPLSSQQSGGTELHEQDLITESIKCQSDKHPQALPSQETLRILSMSVCYGRLPR